MEIKNNLHYKKILRESAKSDSETRIFWEQFVYQLEEIRKSHENSMWEIKESYVAEKEKAEETIKTLQWGQLN